MVFLRAANVGGNNVFRPAQVAAGLAHLGVVNIGAAGTFVVRGKASATSIRREILAAIPFEPSLAIRPAEEILELVRSRPFEGVKFSKDMRGWVAVMCAQSKVQPELPLHFPPAGDWALRFERVEGAYAFGLWRRLPRNFSIPANGVEKAMGVPATVRWWETYERIAKAILAK
ncbi:MAG: DUF1697 domain-containing protein [bacterium]